MLWRVFQADKTLRALRLIRIISKAAWLKIAILVTALNPIIGYELGAKIAKTAYARGRSLKKSQKKDGFKSRSIR